MHRTIFAIPALGLMLLGTAWAMPPHPALLQRVQSGEMRAPYAMSHAGEIRQMGVDSPCESSVVERLRRRALDENVNMLALLVDFPDQSAHVGAGYFDTLLYADQTATLRDFYEEVSYGNLTLLTLNLPSAVGWQRAPQTYGYYVDGQNGFGSYPQNAQGLTEDVVQMVDSVVDFSVYDNDGDGYVDALFIIHSGPGAEFTGSDDDIWSHAWSVRRPLNVDGVRVSRYSMEPEYWERWGDMTCGVYAHEAGHAVFGLPDLYDYDYDSDGLGSWSLMAGGSWNGVRGNSPAHPDAFCRILAGFATPIVVTANLSQVSIPSVEASPTIYRLWTEGMLGNEYFLVENRRQAGYDDRLRGNGLLIYHVDESVNGNDNQWYPGYETNGHYQVALEQADGRWELEHNTSSGDAGDPFPGTENNTFFTYSSVPNSRSYDNLLTYVSVRNIGPSADTMIADLAVRPGAGNPVFAQMPDTTVMAGDTLLIPVFVDNVAEQNITSLRLVVAFDSNVVNGVYPYAEVTDGLIPPSWSVSESHTAETITIDASGIEALDGQGTLLRLWLGVRADASEGAFTPLTFAQFTFNQGSPPVDVENGTLTVGAPHASPQPNWLSFGNVPVGEEAARAFVVRNSGTALLVVDSVAMPHYFTSDFAGPVTIAPQDWYRIRVTFAPDSVRAYDDTLTIFSNATEGPVPVRLTGQGMAAGSAEDDAALVPAHFALAQNYPNPFNPSTIIAYDLPQAGDVSLRVFDLAGREVTVLVDGLAAAGHYRVTFDGGGLASGIYFVRLEAGEFSQTKKMMLMK